MLYLFYFYFGGLLCYFITHCARLDNYWAKEKPTFIPNMSLTTKMYAFMFVFVVLGFHSILWPWFGTRKK